MPPVSGTPTNRLAREKSPYLLQHAHNPVGWYPWGDEAFARARAENKPIFLSVGYSTCHWCHVMERESFEDPEIARLMNEHFVNVKVDREERPDVDRMYMAFVQATTGSGGWPMSVFLTPALEPFFGGTYFPPEDRYGRAGFPQILTSLASAWSEKRADIERSSGDIVRQLRRAATETAPAAILMPSVLDQAFQVFDSNFDRRYAGFGRAPKFPRPVVFDFLLRHHARTGSERAAEMTVATLVLMARGGMYDHLGGGFHRYSVDAYWHVPHFEKMLYDQAQLVTSYVEAWQLTRDPFLERVARETCDYVLRDLCDPATGGFYSAEDADSLVAPGGTDKTEGAFYVWTKDELDGLLGDDARLFQDFYGIEPQGNADDPHGELTGKNVLHAVLSVREAATKHGLDEAEAERRLARARETLLRARAKRPRPHLDDKILCGWNGLMIAALARAARAWGEPRYREAAERAARFARGVLFDADAGTLKRRFRDGEAAIPAYLEDHAFLALGLLELHETTFDPDWLHLAERLMDLADDRFWDEQAGGYWATSGDDPSVLVRMKDDYDGAEPSGNSVAALALLRLAELCGRPEWETRANEVLRFFAGRLAAAPHALPEMLVAFDWALAGTTQVVVAGEPDELGTQALLRAVQQRFLPHSVVIRADATTRSALGGRLPWLRGLVPLGSSPAAYVCKNHTCERPTADPGELSGLLGGRTLVPMEGGA